MTSSKSRSLTISSSIVVEVIGSSPVVGSSYSRMPGFTAIARAMATRRRCPPDSSDGFRSMNCDSRTKPEDFLDALAHRVERLIGFLVQLVADILGDRQRVEQRAFLKDHADVGADFHHLLFGEVVDSWPFTQTLPASGFSSPRISFSEIDLPAPLAPRMIFVWPRRS